MPWAPRSHGHLGLVELLDVGDGLGAGNLPGVQVLDEEAAVRVGPEGAVVEVSGADRVDLDAVGDHLEGEGLDQADAAELRARVGGVLVRADQAGLGVDLDDVGEPLGGGGVLAGQELAQVLGDQEEGT